MFLGFFILSGGSGWLGQCMAWVVRVAESGVCLGADHVQVFVDGEDVGFFV